MAARMGSVLVKSGAKRELARNADGAAPVAAARASNGPTLKRLVWRISSTSPMGEWVDPATAPAVSSRPEPAEVSTGGFLSSSFDLLRGTDIHEYPGDTVPADIYDEFFPAIPAGPAKK
jgi:hypothetical protein